MINWYEELLNKSLNETELNMDDITNIVNHPDADLLKLLDLTFQVRRKYFGKSQF